MVHAARVLIGLIPCFMEVKCTNVEKRFYCFRDVLRETKLDSC